MSNEDPADTQAESEQTGDDGVVGVGVSGQDFPVLRYRGWFIRGCVDDNNIVLGLKEKKMNNNNSGLKSQDKVSKLHCNITFAALYYNQISNVPSK